MSFSKSHILHNMLYGVERREAIVTYLQSHPEDCIFVNSSHCPQLHEDKDLEYMLKKGILVRHRIKWPSWSSRNYYKTVLTLNKETN